MAMDGNGRCDGNSTVMDLMCDGNWTTMEGLMAMDQDGRLIDRDRWWMTMDGYGQRDGHSTAMDLTTMDGN